MSRASRGDTLIEVLLALTIFTTAVIGVMYVMNRSIGVSQRSLEITQSRTQIDNQIELLRHVHNLALVSSGRSSAGLAIGNSSGSGELTAVSTWKEITSAARLIDPSQLPSYDSVDNVRKCNPNDVFSTIDSAGNAVYNDSVAAKAFFLDPSDGSYKSFKGNSSEPATFARISRGDRGANSEMIWIFAVKTKEDGATRNINSNKLTVYYDFHIRACWHSPIDGDVAPITSAS